MAVTILCGAIAPASAQFNVDSVEHLLTRTWVPVERLKLLRQLSKAADPAVSGRYALATVRYADSLLVNGHAGDATVLTQKGGGLWNQGWYYDRLGLKDSAMIWYERGAAQWSASGDKERMAFADQSLGEKQIDRGAPSEALVRLQRVLAFRQATADTAGMVAAHSAMGLAYYMLGDPAPALEQQSLALEFAERLGLHRFIAQNLLNIGLIYQDQYEMDTALACYHRSVIAFKRAGDTVACVTPLNNAALIHAMRDELPHAMAVCEEGLALVDPTEFPAGTSILTSTLGRVHSMMGDHDLAVRFGEQAVADAATSPVVDYRATVLINLGTSLYNAGKFQRALAVANEAQALFDRYDLSVHRHMYLADLLADIYTRTGPPERALAYMREYVVLKDSVANSGIRDQLRRIQLAKQSVRDSVVHAHELEEVEHARAMEGLRADRNRDRALLAALVALVLIAGTGAFFVLDRKRRKARFEKDVAQLETQALRSQMNPHFIFNALNSIGSFVQQNEPDRAVSYLTRFARLMRLVLENSRQAEVPLKDDLEALDAYLHLERARSEKFDYTISVDPAIDQEETLVPPLVVQPFVENAIWHGMAGKVGKGHIRLSVTMQGDPGSGTGMLLMAIEDDGVGRHPKKVPEEVPDSAGAQGAVSDEVPDSAVPGATRHRASGDVKKTSLATTITKARLDLVQKQKGKPAGFRIIDLAQGTRVEVSLPVGEAA